MTTSKKSKPAKKAEWKGYHKVNLSKEQEAHFEVWATTQEVQITDLDVLCNAGYKFSLSWDDYHQGVSAGLYCTQAKMDWAGYTLSAWAAEANTAIKLLFYKHYILCEEVWDIAEERTERQHSKFG